MPKKLYFDLSASKREKIAETALSEFSRYSYYESSTNRIVKNAGISKGSLFKYFDSKEDLYFYILDLIITAMGEFMESKLGGLPQNLFERAIAFAEIEFSWHLQEPVKYRLLMRAFQNFQNNESENSEIHKKTKERYSALGDDLYYRIFDDIDSESLKWGKRQTVHVLKLFLKSFNEEFITESKDEKDIAKLRSSYVLRLREYLNILKEGLE